MKFTKSILALLAVAAICISATAQTNLPPLSPSPNFLGSVGSYLTAVNPAYSFESNRLEIAIGSDYVGGVDWSEYIKAQYDFKRFDIEANFRNIGIGGKIQSLEIGGGYALIQKFDTKVILSLEGGYDWNRASGIIEPGVVLRKKGTENTFFEIGVTWPFYFTGLKNQYPNIRVGTGFTF